MKTLADFIASREYCADLGARMGADYFEDAPRAGYVYGGDCYIEQNADGTFYLILHRDEYAADTLAELEPILYAWAVTECPEDMGLSNDVHTFICELQNAIGMGNFARAMLANMGESNPSVCHMQDYCDANAVALSVADDDTDKAGELYNRARPVLRGKADA